MCSRARAPDVRLQVQEDRGVVVLAPHGEVNFENTALVAAAIRDRLGPTPRIVLDLSRVPYMDSTSLGTVLDALRSVRELDGDLRLVGLAANVRRVFDLMDGERLFRIYATLEEGVSSFAPSEAPVAP